MGDNRAISTDSRSFGPLKINEINHKIVLKLKSSKKKIGTIKSLSFLI